MVTTGIVWGLFLVLQGWLVLVTIYALQASEYHTPVAVFWLCQLAVIAVQIFWPRARYITPIPWMLIYLIAMFAYMWLSNEQKDLNLLHLGLSMQTMALYCLLFYVLQYDKPRDVLMNYVLTLGLNIFTVWQGLLLYGGAKKALTRGGK